MIKITRLSKPTILQENEVSWTEEVCRARKAYYQDLKKFRQGTLSEKPLYPQAKKSYYAHKQIKTSLQTMFGRKCAYCESHITAVSYPHVEHFRPQSIYPKLAYHWDNLLLACTVCNSSYKRNQFPLVDGRHPVKNEDEPCSLDDSDNHLLVNPCLDDPEQFFIFEDEYIVCRNERATVTRDVCGLNRDDLNDARRQLLPAIETIAKAYKAADRDGRIQEKNKFAHTLKKYIASSAPYVAMTRSKLKAMGVYTAILQNV